MKKPLQKLSALAVFCCCLFGAGSALGQTNPTPQSLPYTQDFNDLPHNATEYPAGWQGWQLASSISTTLRTSAPTGDRALVANVSSSSTTGGVLNYNGKIGILGSGSTDPSIAFAINTLQKTSVTVAFDIMTVRNPYGSSSTNTKINEAVLQYRVGTTGTFINIEGTEYQNNTVTLVTSGNTEGQKVERILINLPEAAENNEVVQLRWANRDVSGGGSRASFAVDNIEVTSLIDSKNPIVLAPATVAFGDVVLNQGTVTSYGITSANITDNVQLTATGNFTISKQEGVGFASSLIFSAAEIAANPTVYVRVTPTTAGELTGAITHTSAGAKTAVTELTANAVSPFVQNFNTCGTTLPGGWNAYSVTGDQIWACSTFGRETAESPRNNAVQINGFAGSARENEDWMISPSLNLTNFNIAALSFWIRTAFRGPGLKLMISTNYDGTSAPATATWTELDGDFPATATDAWKQSVVNLSAYKAPSVHIAFVYTSEAATDRAARWTLDDFAVENLDQMLIASNEMFDFGVVEVPNTSAPQTFKFSALGYPQGMTLAVGTDFQLSKNGQTYTSSIVYTAAEASAANIVYVRYKPGTSKLRSTSTITYTSGTFTTERGMLTGSSLPKSQTLDIVSWNLAWFGSTSGGPSNLEVQYQNAKRVVQTLDADIIAFQEISNDAQMERLVSELPGYSFVKSDVFSYSQRPSTGGTLDPQKLYIVYKNETVKVKSQKVLLNKLYQDILAGVTTLQNYPGSSDSFWASGRLPYMVEVEATMNGITQNLHLLNLHTRANSGTDVSRYNMRKYDVDVLKDSIAAQYPNVNLVMLGDMNEDVDISVVNNLPSSLDAFVLDSNYKTLTYNLSTTGAFTYAGGSFQSFLDHIIVSKSLVDEYIEESINIENQFLSSISSFRTSTSDHIPVSARFSFSNTPAVRFTEAYASRTEDAGKFAVSLSLSKAQPKAHTVFVTVKDGATATAADYTSSPVVANNVIAVPVAANSTSATFDITVIDDKLVEPTEQATFFISNVTTDLGIGTARNFTLAIQDNDIPVGIAINQEPLRLYPNPTKTTANIQLPEHVTVLENLSLVAMTSEGIKLFEVNGTLQQVQQQFNDKVSALRAGMYIIKVQTAKETFQARLVKN